MDTHEPNQKSRAEINRENSKKSTGPRTTAGKAKSRLNAQRHKLTGQVVLLPEGDFNAYLKLLHQYTELYQPDGPLEETYTAQIAHASWKLNACQSWAQTILAISHDEGKQKIGKSNHPEAHDAFATGKAAFACNKELMNLSLYRQRDERMLAKATAALKTLQEERKLKERLELEEAAQLMALHEAEEKARLKAAQETYENLCIEATLKGEQAPEKPSQMDPTPYLPSKDGFVIALEQIVDYVARGTRRNHAFKYHDTGKIAA